MILTVTIIFCNWIYSTPLASSAIYKTNKHLPVHIHNNYATTQRALFMICNSSQYPRLKEGRSNQISGYYLCQSIWLNVKSNHCFEIYRANDTVKSVHLQIRHTAEINNSEARPVASCVNNRRSLRFPWREERMRSKWANIRLRDG